MNHKPVYHEVCKLPLYCLAYDVVIAEDIEASLEHLEHLYPGVKLKIPKTLCSYSCTLSHPTLGETLVFLLATEGYDKENTIAGAIAHEATNMSWLITDMLELDLSFGKHTTQSYIVGELVQRVNDVLMAYDEHDKGLEGL